MSSSFLAGRQPPASPVALQVTSLSASSVVIPWLVPRISYTPEEYFIAYGRNEQVLDANTSVTAGNQDITTTMERFYNALYDLQPQSLYFYNIVAINDAGITRSPLLMFYTSLQGECNDGQFLLSKLFVRDKVTASD